MSRSTQKPLPLAETPYEPGEARSLLPYLSPTFHPNMLTGQDEKFVHYIISGMSVTAAATAVGMPVERAAKAAKRPEIVAAIEYFRSKNREKLEFTVETAHKMYLDAYKVAEDASDSVAMKSVVDSLVKLHGIGVAPAKGGGDTPRAIENKKQAERASDDKLLEAAGYDPSYLTPEPKRRPVPEVVDGTYTDVPKKP